MRMGGELMAASPEVQGLRGRHVLFAFLGFFGVIFAVNGVFLYAALSTHTGVVANEPYRKGLNYNQRIAAFQAQEQLGWAEETTLDRDAGLTLTLHKSDGTPVSGLFVAGTFGRPSTDKFDRRIVLTEVEPGRYSAKIEALEPGAWIVNLEATWIGGGDKGPVYRLRKRLWLKS